MDAIKDSGSGNALGHVAKDQKFASAFLDSWRSFWSKNSGGVTMVDISTALTLVMAPKEDGELAIVKKAAQATSDVFSKYLKEQIMDIIDNDKVRSTIQEDVYELFYRHVWSVIVTANGLFS